MNWIKRILNKFLKKDNIKLIEEPRKSKRN